MMKRSFLYVVVLLTSLPLFFASCKKNKQPDLSYTIEKYEELGMPDCDKIWNNNDYFVAIGVLDKIKAKDSLALPRYDSKKSGKLFRHMIGLENLLFVDSNSVPLYERAYHVQAFLGIQSDLSRVYTNIYSREQYYNKELVHLYMFGIAVTQKMLDLAYRINRSDKPQDLRMKAGFPSIQAAYVVMMSYILGNQQHVSLFDKHDMKTLSDSLSGSLERNMKWIDPTAKKMLAKKLKAVADSTSTKKIKKEYMTLARELESN